MKSGLQRRDGGVMENLLLEVTPNTKAGVTLTIPKAKAATSNCSPVYGGSLKPPAVLHPSGKDHSLWLSAAIPALSDSLGCSPRCNTGWVPPTTEHRSQLRPQENDASGK